MTPDAVAADCPRPTTVRYLDPARIRLFRHGAAVRMTIEDECSVLDLAARALFPITQTAPAISLRDGKGDEVGILSTPDQLDHASRQVLAEALSRHYLIPRLTRIRKARERFGVVEWTVDTDRGPRAFTTRNLREELRMPAPGRYLLRDVDGNRYDIPSLAALDPASQALLLEHV
jgi:hypothetical protein